MRLFHASTASRSASLRACVARSAAVRTDAPEIVSRDLVPIARGCILACRMGKPLQIAVDHVPGTTEAAMARRFIEDQRCLER
jgi:hypothetical protein